MKLSKRVFEVVEERQHSAEWCAKIAARIEADDESLPDHFTRGGYGSHYYFGLRDAAHSTIESLLMAHKAYAGFSHELCQKTQARWNHYDLRKAQ
jgi:hypothetical protein